MGFSLQQIGNFPQFWREEMGNVLYLAWIAITGACMLVLFQFQKTPAKLDAMLPTILPTYEEPYAKPYAVRDIDKEQMGMFDYLFSYNSDFPFNLKMGIEMVDDYLKFFGGMGSYLYSAHRNFLKSSIEILDVDNYFIDAFCFYMLPTILLYLVWIPIIPFVSFTCINFISCFYQLRLKNAYIYAFACIFSWFDYEGVKAMADLSQLPQSVINYFLNVFLGGWMSFFFVPGISALYSLAVWYYVIGFIYFMPLAIIYYGDTPWREFGSKLLDQIGRHYIGLTVLFLYGSISIANKNLDQKVAWGTHIGIIILILMSLIPNLADFLNSAYHYFKGDITTFPNPLDLLKDKTK